ncbi:MAG: PfkB family carbohydrate kinase [Candidatus Acidiferrales bacterium]|jgi:sugar/nucleoside kinase (ribokinase family)
MCLDIPIVDVVGVGQNALDTLIELPSFPAFNSEVEFLSARALPGGQIATAVIACQQWGFKTRYIGKVGDDAAGQLHRAEFDRAGVESHLTTIPNCMSQSSYILVHRPTGERTILYRRDDRLGLFPEDLQRNWITASRLLHVDGHNAVAGTVAAHWARDAGAVVMADLDHIYPGIQELLPLLDYPITSRSFPTAWTGEPDLFRALKTLRARYGNRLACATLGCDGALAWDGSRFWYSPAFRVNAIDATGAGDIFDAAFAYGLLHNWPVDFLLDFSCAAAGLNCTILGARGGIKPIEEIQGLRHNGDRLPAAFSQEELARAART